MNYVGIDIHKRYSICAAQDGRGRQLAEARIEGNATDGFVEYFKGLGGKSRVVIEACWNWAAIYERLEGLRQVEDIVVANPLKTRLIAEAQIKTDKLDARALAMLLRGGFVPAVHVPAKAARDRKNLLRQRLYWSRLRTRLRNRVHALLDRQRGLELPPCSDLFGRKGMRSLEELSLPDAGRLPEPDRLLLEEHLELLEVAGCQMADQEKEIAATNRDDPMTQRLLSLPGVGPILAAVIAAEIDQLERFTDASHLCAYSGLVPTTHASGGNVYNGRLLQACNKWLRWAWIEAAWVAIGCSGYFGALYKRHRARGKKANTAITIVARRMCRIAFALLNEKRDYTAQAPQKPPPKNFPGRSRSRLAAHP